MGKAFFTGWKTWEKLVFCLAGAIVLTLLAGSIKLAYTHWQLRKYAAVAEKEKEEEQTLQRQMSQRRPPNNGDEVPFGIRAIEKGIPVEGVWLSRPNTPVFDKPPPSPGSSTWEHVPRRSRDIDLKKHPALRQDGRVSGSSLTASRPPSAEYERAVSAQRLSSSEVSRDSSSDMPVTKPPRSRHPPCSYNKYSSVVQQPKPPPTYSTSQGLEAIRRASTSINPEDRNSGSSESDNGGNDVDSIASCAPRLFNTEPLSQSRRPSADFEMLNSHRMSQAAETGQLTPRVRKSSQSGDVPGMSLPAPAVYPNDQEYFAFRQKVPSSPSDASFSHNPFSTPRNDALPPAVRRASMPDVTPFAEFCQNLSQAPRPNGTRSSSVESRSRVRLSGALLSSQRSASPSMASYSSPVEPPPPEYHAQPSPQRTSFERRESQVIRGHGTGFEVLRPGTFNPPPSTEYERLKAGAPPISLYNMTSGKRSTSADGRNRLQKKRRPSMDSNASSGKGRRSRSRDSTF